MTRFSHFLGFFCLLLSTTKMVALAQEAVIQGQDNQGQKLADQLAQLKDLTDLLGTFQHRELQDASLGSKPASPDLTKLFAGLGGPGALGGGQAFPGFGFASRQAPTDAVGNLFAGIPALGDLFANTNLAQAVETNLPSLAKSIKDFDPSKLLSVLSEPGAAQKFFPPLSGQYESLMRSANNGDAEAAGVLALLSAIFNLVSSILYIVSGSLGTGAASIGLIPASLALVTAPTTLGLAAVSYANTASITLSDDGFTDKWSVALLALASRLEQVNNGTLQGSLMGYKQQLTNAGSLLSLISNPMGTSSA